MSSAGLPPRSPSAVQKGHSARLVPHSLFTVPKGVKLLDSAQLMALERAFATWRAGAVTAQAIASRGRMWLLFQLLRHSGARLGEVQALHVRSDLSTQACTVRFGHNGKLRELPLPRAFCRELVRLLDGPAGTVLGEYPFKVDQGYVRRVFYARAEEAGIPRELVTPRVIRNTRAVELLRSGVPLAVVREVLGQASADLTAVLQSYSSGDMRAIVRRLAMDAGERSSARNSFKGYVTGIRTDSIMAEVCFCTAGGHEITSLITMESLRALELDEGSPVGATVKAPYVDVKLCRNVNVTGRSGMQRNVTSEYDMAPVEPAEVAQVVAGKSYWEESRLKKADARRGTERQLRAQGKGCGETLYSPEVCSSTFAAIEGMREIPLAKGCCTSASFPCSNRLTGCITQVRSSGVMVEVMGACHDGTQLCALMAVSDAERMGIIPVDAGDGQDVAADGVKDMAAEFSFKPLSVVLHAV